MRQPSDFILRLAAEAKAAQMQAQNQAPATPFSLKQPLQAGFFCCSLNRAHMTCDRSEHISEITMHLIQDQKLMFAS